MIGQYKGFIPENSAPPNVSAISIHNADGVKKASMKVPSFMRYPSGEKLYSIGLISDTHLQPASVPACSMKLDNALTWFEEQGAAFVCHAGDITNHGFWNSDGTQDLTQFADYKRVCGLHPNLPVYAACGNHDSYFQSITNNLSELEEFTGHSLYFSIEHERDLYFFIGQPSNVEPMSEEALTWLESELANSHGKRCLIFIHPCTMNDSGNALGSYDTNMFMETWAHLERFRTLLRSYNTMLFHGHSHFQFKCQERDKCANYTCKNGFRSLHIPSLQGYRDCYTGEEPVESLGYLVDVFDDCLVFRGRDFGTANGGTIVNPKWIPVATYKIDMVRPEKEEVWYSVTNHLTNCTNGNTVANVLEGVSYSAVISPASGYENPAVTVTMGGAEITSSVVSGGNISIAEVTGDIIITATATKVVPKYTNLADPSSADWVAGRLGSDGTVRTDTTAAIVTNFIKCNSVVGDVVRIKGLGALNKYNTSVKNAALGNLASGQASNTSGYYYTYSYDSTTGVVTLTTTKAVGYFRFSGILDNTAADVVITLNEPIT